MVVVPSYGCERQGLPCAQRYALGKDDQDSSVVLQGLVRENSPLDRKGLLRGAASGPTIDTDFRDLDPYVQVMCYSGASLLFRSQ